MDEQTFMGRLTTIGQSLGRTPGDVAYNPEFNDTAQATRSYTALKEGGSFFWCLGMHSWFGKQVRRNLRLVAQIGVQNVASAALELLQENPRQTWHMLYDLGGTSIVELF